MASQTIVLFGIHERATNLGFHMQVCDKSSAVLLSETTRFIEPGTRIISDAMKSYHRLTEFSYEHGTVCWMDSLAVYTNECRAVSVVREAGHDFPLP